jgi:hypothetical protein
MSVRAAFRPNPSKIEISISQFVDMNKKHDFQNNSMKNFAIPSINEKFWAFWIIFGIVILARTSEPQIASDGVARFDDLRLLLDGQTPSSKYSMTQIIFSIVPYAIGNYFDNPKGLVSYFNFVLFVGLVLAFFFRFQTSRQEDCPDLDGCIDVSAAHTNVFW